MNFKLDRAEYTSFEDINRFQKIEVDWKLTSKQSPSVVRALLPPNFQTSEQSSWSDNPGINGKSDVYSFITQKNDQYGIVNGLWVSKNGSPFWPEENITLSTLKDPEILACDHKQSSHCIFGLDYHFRRQKWWHRIPVLRYIYSQFSPNANPYETNDTYLSVYQIQNNLRKVLSNPCSNKEILIYTDQGYNNGPLMLIHCSDGSSYRGEVTIN